MNVRVVLFALAVLPCIIYASSSVPQPGVIVDIAGFGKVRGTANGTSHTVSFTGIRYAKPPVGNLRFRAPVPASPLPEGTIFNANEDPICPQPPSPLVPDLTKATEDCLTVNIWAPENFQGRKLPVLVFIHGGAFFLGTPYGRINGDFIASEGIVFVSIAYRLGLFGFYAHPAIDETNFGFLDQRLALEWVHEKIHHFGGDASQTTVWGVSAGAMSVLTQLASPLWEQKKLFNRAILMSPALNSGFYTREDSDAAGVDFAKSIGCTQTDLKAQADCLRSFGTNDVPVPAPPRLLYFHTTQQSAIFPVPSDKTFPTHYDKEFSQIALHDVDIIFGTTSQEGTLFAYNTFPILKPDTDTIAAMIADVFSIIDKDLPSKVAEVYPFSSLEDNNWKLGVPPGDLFFSCPSQDLINLATRRNPNGNYYGYLFNHSSSTLLGAFHSSDQFFGFRQVAHLGESELNKNVATEFSKNFVDFARHGKPSQFSRFTAQEKHFTVVGSNKDTNSITYEITTSVKSKECEMWASFELSHEKLRGVAPNVNPLRRESIVSALINRDLIRLILRHGRTKVFSALGGAGLVLLVGLVLLLVKCCRRKAPQVPLKGKSKRD